MLEWLQHPDRFLLDSPAARLFLIIALGYFLGELKLFGQFRLGVVAVLFVGLGFGAFQQQWLLPSEFQTLGLILFLYCFGLASGPGFVRAFRKTGLQWNLCLLVGIMTPFLLTWYWIPRSGLDRELIIGVFCGSLTNTPALGAVTESLERAGNHQAALQSVVGYGIAYPMGILVTLILLTFRSWKQSSAVERLADRPHPISGVTFRVEHLRPDGTPWDTDSLAAETGRLLTRYQLLNEPVQLVTKNTLLPIGSLIVAVIKDSHEAAFTQKVGPRAATQIQNNFEAFEVHRYFLTNPALAGKSIGELNLESQGALVTRVRRADIDLSVREQTILQLGDRVRVLSYKEQEPKIRELFGNSVQSMSEAGFLTFAVGIILGLVLGQIPIPVPGVSEPLRLGAAGGPLVAGLVLGAIGRSGPMLWNLPITTNLALRHFGILLFLACVGLKAGAGLLPALKENAPPLILAAIVLPLAGHLTLWLTARIAGIRTAATILGLSAGFQTQPAALAFAEERTDQGPLHLAYATVYPLALVCKILLAQILLLG